VAKKVKAKSCPVCSKPFIPFNSLQVVCGYVCAIKYNDKKEIDKRIKQYKSNVQSLSDLESIAKKVFQTWVRRRDELLPCISCGRTESPQFDGGHFYSAEQYSGLIFNEINVNKQCCYCNRDLYGNPLEYRKGLIERYGELAVEGLDELSNEKRQYKFTKDELKEITTKYRLKIKNRDFK
jgi:hypothetical protein